LSKIPVLKWFFGKEKTGETENRELVFFISPSIIKEWKEEKAPSLATPPPNVSEAK
jgi:type II secretory pathway component GspD/PulD (secretin)